MVLITVFGEGKASETDQKLALCKAYDLSNALRREGNPCENNIFTCPRTLVTCVRAQLLPEQLRFAKMKSRKKLTCGKWAQSA
jgi:hypothetical protein